MTDNPGTRVSRRSFLTGGGIALGAAAVAGTAGFVIGENTADGHSPGAAGNATTASGAEVGTATVPFFGKRQAGIDTPAQSYLALAAMDLRPGANRDTMRRLMRVWTDDASRLSAGRPALADAEPTLAAVPARLTVTFGFGPKVFDVAGIGSRRPSWLAALPAFKTDKLQERWSGGDLVMQICADDDLTVSHTLRTLQRDALDMASPRWVQRGFRRAVGSEPAGTTMRNLMGQVDGTRNPDIAAEPELVWSGGSDGWLSGGTSLVVRRIAMNLDTWDELDAEGKEKVIGRRLDSGAPLTGKKERDEPDLEATDKYGFTVIDSAAHIRRARTSDTGQRFLRRGYNYDGIPPAGSASVSDSGLVFITFQADVTRQFVPIQQRVAELDLLNTWATTIGSAVFAVPPGCGKGEYIGQDLFG